MNIVVVMGMAVALAMDCFAVSLGMSCGPGRVTMRQALRPAFSFGIFQFAMPVLGWQMGERILLLIQKFDHWAAFGLLAFVGLKMICESLKAEKGSGPQAKDRTRGWPLIILSVATSIDALAVGLSLSVLEVNIFYPAVLIGLVCFALTMLGVHLGPLVGRVVGKRSELAGGIILIGIGIKILADHL